MARPLSRLPLRFDTLEDRLTPVTVPLDPTFGVGGVATLPRPPIGPGGEYAYTPIREMVAAPAGGVYAISSTSYSSTRVELLRLNARGELDTSFDADGRVLLAEYTYEQRSYDFLDLAVQADGKVVVLGTVTDPYVYGTDTRQQADIVVRRYNPDGSLDTTFGTDGTATVGFDAEFQYGSYDTASALALAPDGRVVVVGRVAELTRSAYFDPYLGREIANYYQGGNTSIGVARLTADGQLDPTFDGDGRIRIGREPGFSERFDEPYQTELNRLVQVNDVAVAPDGGVILVGSASEGYPVIYAMDTPPLPPPPPPLVPSTPPPGDLSIWPPYYSQEMYAFAVRLTPGGQLDAAFDGDGILGFDLAVPAPNPTDRIDYTNAISQEAKWVGVLGDGRLVVGVIDRTTPTTRLAVFRLGADAKADASYGTSGVATLSDGWGFSDLALAADGRVFVVTGTDAYRAGGGVFAYTSFLSVFTPDGVLDARFGDDGRQQLPIGTIEEPVTPIGLIVSPDGQITVGATSFGPIYYPTEPPIPTTAIDTSIIPLPGPVSIPQQQTLFVRYAAEPGVVPGVYVSATGGEVAIYQTGSDGKLYLNTGSFTPFPGYTGTVRMTSADLNGDGILDTIYAMGTGGSRVRVDLGLPSDVQPVAMVAPIVFDAYEASFQGGIFITAGDIDGDGKAELVTSPNDGGSARVQIFRLVNREFVAVDNFFAIEDPAYRGGGRVALGDLNADRKLDLIVGAGKGGSTRTAVYDGVGLLRGTATPPKLIGDFFAIPDTINLRDGVYVAAGDLNSDGRAELIVGSGDGGGPRILVLNGASLLASRDVGASVVGTFFVDNVANRAGARVAVRDTNGDGTLDVIASGGTGTENAVRVYTGPSIWAAHGAAPPTAQEIDWTGDTGSSGIFVG